MFRSSARQDASALALLPFLDQIPELALVLEDGAILAYLNPSLLRIWPAGEELLGRDCWDSFPELLDADTGRQCRAARADGHPRAFTTLCLNTRKRFALRAVPMGRYLVLYGAEATGE